MDNDSVDTLQAAIQSAEVVMPCANLSANLSFFTKKLGFAVAAVFPADNPSVVVLVGHSIRIRLESGVELPAHTLRLNCDLAQVSFADGEEVTAPNGTKILIKETNPPLIISPENQSLVISKINDNASWKTGRAGMLYRDLIPNRQGGRFIASHIRIPEGGPVSDYVHYHKVRFQMIFCYKGWVKVAYEDQGEPILMRAGDCFLQPPEIRHQVLESSDGLEVIEVGCPAEHETHGDLVMSLPTGKNIPEKLFKEQVFLYHDASTDIWNPWRHEGFESRDIGMSDATNGVAGVHVVRSAGGSATPVVIHNDEFLFLFVLSGGLTYSQEGNSQSLEAGDSIVIPRGTQFALTDCSEDMSFLEVTLPGAFTAIQQETTLEQLATGSPDKR
jgi:quercetin dioxygenase-like cupin family protein